MTGVRSQGGRRALWIKAVAAVLLVALWTVAGGSAWAQGAELRWGTISAGGAWQVVGSAMLEDIRREHPDITGSILPSGTSANVLGVHKGTFNIAFSLTDATADAWNGVNFFQEHGQIRDLRNVATLYPHATQIVVWADSDIRSVADLKGKRVSPAGRGLSSHLLGERLLRLYGIEPAQVRMQFLSFDDAAQNMIDGHLDALLFTSVPFPFAPIIRVASRAPIRLLPIDPDIAAQMAEAQGVEAFALPAGLYQGVDEEIPGFATRAHIIVREDMDEDVVYRITKTIHENFDRYGDVIAVMRSASRDGMAGDAGIPLHPGARRYYEEQGLLNP